MIWTICRANVSAIEYCIKRTDGESIGEVNDASKKDLDDALAVVGKKITEEDVDDDDDDDDEGDDEETEDTPVKLHLQSLDITRL